MKIDINRWQGLACKLYLSNLYILYIYILVALTKELEVVSPNSSILHDGHI